MLLSADNVRHLEQWAMEAAALAKDSRFPSFPPQLTRLYLDSEDEETILGIEVMLASDGVAYFVMFFNLDYIIYQDHASAYVLLYHMFPHIEFAEMKVFMNGKFQLREREPLSIWSWSGDYYDYLRDNAVFGTFSQAQELDPLPD